MKSNRQKAEEKKRQLQEAEKKLFSLEEKWIKNEVTVDTYQRWYSTYNHIILNLKGAIERLSEKQGSVFEILERNLHLLSDMRYVYLKSDTLQKREFVRRVFDNNLYYQDGIYRTPTMLKLFTHNALKIKEKGYLIYEKKERFFDEIPLSGLKGFTVEHIIPFLTFLVSLPQNLICLKENVSNISITGIRKILSISIISVQDKVPGSQSC